MLKKLISAVSAFALVSGIINIPPAKAHEMKEINYNESVETISNPAAGYTKTIWAVCKPNETPVYSPDGNLVLFFVDIGGFSAGANGITDENGNYTEGKDYDLDEKFFESWRETFENCRKNGCMIALRFRYDANGKDNPEPSSFEQVLKHIQQIKDSYILDDYSDIIAFVESGFVGKWGEQHGGKYTSVEYKAKLLDAMLNCVPYTIPVTVRTPDIFAEWAGIKRSELDDESLYEKASLSADYQKILTKRVGLYNDGYMGSNSDLGTYANRETETNWLNRVTTDTYFGGEFSGDIEFAKQYDTYLPENAIPEMYKTRLSYINSNIFKLYNDYTFDEKYSVKGVDNSAYYGQSVFKFIRDHIGYRFVLRKSALSESAEQGGKVDVGISVENTGFANPVIHPNTSVIIEKDGKFMIANMLGIDCHNWYSCKTSDEKFSLQLPDNIETGDWNVYLRLSVSSNNIENLNHRAIRFANENIWDSTLGANYIGTFTIKKSKTHGTDNDFHDYNCKSGSTYVYTLNGKTVVDGTDSGDSEWTEDMKLAEKDGQTIYAKADDKYLYIKSNMPTGSKAPVYNLQFKNPENGENYWLYYASNGFVYFNHSSYDGCMCKWQGDTVEFRIPFGDTMGIKAGSKIENLRIFLQDSGNEWKLMGDITAPEYTIPKDFMVYSAPYEIRLREGAYYSAEVRHALEKAKYQWYHDGEELKGMNDKIIYLENVSKSDKGTYSVKIISADGTEKIADIFSVAEIISENPQKIIYGDANDDGNVSVSDAVKILQYLANSETYPLTEQGKINGDVDGVDGITGKDAYYIQLYDAGATELPVK